MSDPVTIRQTIDRLRDALGDDRDEVVRFIMSRNLLDRDRVIVCPEENVNEEVDYALALCNPYDLIIVHTRFPSVRNECFDYLSFRYQGMLRRREANRLTISERQVRFTFPRGRTYQDLAGLAPEYFIVAELDGRRPPSVIAESGIGLADVNTALDKWAERTRKADEQADQERKDLARKAAELELDPIQERAA